MASETVIIPFPGRWHEPCPSKAAAMVSEKAARDERIALLSDIVEATILANPEKYASLTGWKPPGASP